MTQIKWLIRLVAFVAIVLLILLGPVIGSMAEESSSNTAPTDFCSGGVSWVVRSQAALADPKCPEGTFVATSDEWGKQSSATFSDAETFRNGRDTTYWFEPSSDAAATSAPNATAEPEAVATVVSSSSSAVHLDWPNFCSGDSPFVFSGGAILNAASIDQFVPPCSGKYMAVFEPWRAGCTYPQDMNPYCNVGMGFVFADRDQLLEWLDANGWPEGSIWYNPDPVVMARWQSVWTAPGVTLSLPQVAMTATATPAQTATAVDNGEAEWLRQLLELIEMRLAQLGE